MRSYLHHLGDWAAHTATLPWMECAAYHKLIEIYYVTERPLPPDVVDVFKAIGAVATVEKKAVVSVLEKFFTLQTDGYHQKRCDDELARHAEFRAMQQKKVNKRWNNGHDVDKSVDKVTPKAGTVHAVLGKRSANGYNLVTGQKEPLVDLGGLPGSTHGNAAGNTMGKNPVLPTINLLPKTKDTDTLTAETARRAAGVCRLKGFEVKATDPSILALIADGATADDFGIAAQLASAADKPWAYVTGIVSNRLADAVRHAQEGPKTGSGGPNYPMLPRSTDPR